MGKRAALQTTRKRRRRGLQCLRGLLPGNNRGLVIIGFETAG